MPRGLCFSREDGVLAVRVAGREELQGGVGEHSCGYWETDHPVDYAGWVDFARFVAVAAFKGYLYGLSLRSGHRTEALDTAGIG